MGCGFVYIYTMNWASLYTTRRTGDKEGKQAIYDPVRNSFLQDYDRIIFSSAFRRLQNKTQVFPLPGAIFVHNRLTHSLEVASVGRSLGKAVGTMIAAKYEGETNEFKEFYRHELSSVIASACLAHDIGNPPFGHSGEDAIRSYFNELEGDVRKRIHDELSENQRKDFELFEGNSNALRTLTNSFNEPEPGGYKLTHTTLASLVKYPCASIEGFNKASGLIATKKSGFFDSELHTYEQIAGSLFINKKEGYQHVYARHPFVYLTEAADDICYRVIDMEDAHRLHIVSFDTFSNMFLPFFDNESDYSSRAYLEGKLANINDDNQKVQYIRARWIGLMIDKLAKAFMANEAALLSGALEQDLLKCLSPDDQKLIKKINEFSVAHIYNYRAVVEIEIAGYNVIGGLLKEFVHAVLYPNETKSAKIIKLVSKQFRITPKDNKNIYKDVQSLVDFIAGMTDLYALDLYRKITGITIPELR